MLVPLVITRTYVSTNYFKVMVRDPRRRFALCDISVATCKGEGHPPLSR